MVVVGMNIEQLPTIIELIVNSAFGWQEAAAGGVAYTVAQAMQSGVARGLFSNEAGMGSAANVAASASPTPNHPASQGFVQMIGVFMDTIVICSATAAIILLAGDLSSVNVSEGDKGIQLTIAALTNHVGDWGGLFVAFASCYSVSLPLSPTTLTLKPMCCSFPITAARYCPCSACVYSAW